MRGPRARLRAQAKINPVLRVLEREPNGYHTIETLFVRIDLADQVSVEVTPGASTLRVGGPTCPPAGLGPSESNLAWKAAVAFRGRTGWPGGWHIDVEKEIPVGGGLGGGSADAGAVLRLLNAMAPEPLTDDDLLELARPLGADVPFLTQDRSVTSVGRHYGEVLRAGPTLEARPCLVIAPAFGVNTAAAYGWLDADRLTRGAPNRAPLDDSTIATWDAVQASSENDFEPVVFSRHPEFAGAFADIARAAPAALTRMSGSGSTIVVLGDASGLVAPAGYTWVNSATSERVADVEFF